MKNAAIVFLLAILFLACKKSADRSCFKSNGKPVKEDRPASEIRSIYLHDHINLFITQDTFNTILVEAPANLVNFVSTTFEGTSLVIKNENKCDFLRSYKEGAINVYVTLVTLDSIYFTGSGNIVSTNTLTAPVFEIDFWGASGSVNLMLNAGTFYGKLHTGPGDITLSGSAKVSALYSNGNGFFYLTDFFAEKTHINNSGTGDFYINVTNEMEVGIHSSGSVYYTGAPVKINSEITGEGNLIKI